MEGFFKTLYDQPDQLAESGSLDEALWNRDTEAWEQDGLLTTDERERIMAKVRRLSSMNEEVKRRHAEALSKLEVA